MNKEYGFTLLEMVLIIVVMGILYVAEFNYFPVSSVNLKTQTLRLVDDIRYTQSLSMSKYVVYNCTIVSNSYIIGNSTSQVANTGLAPGITATIISPNYPGCNSISFNTKGIPYSCGNIATQNVTITLTNEEEESNSVTVVPMTGLVVSTA